VPYIVTVIFPMHKGLSTIYCYPLFLIYLVVLLLLRVGRTSEAKDSARVALKSPWWTLGCGYEEAAELAGWEDEQIEFIREKITEEGKREDLKKGKAPEQVSSDKLFLTSSGYSGQYFLC